MKSTDSDPEFRGKTVTRVLDYREEFFVFMKDFTDDLGESYDEEWQCLENFFNTWARRRCHWDNQPDPRDNEVELPCPDQPAAQLPGTRGYEEFNQLLPIILLAVIDESLRYPELLDASPVNPDGSIRRISRRNIPYLITPLERDEIERVKVIEEDMSRDQGGLYDDALSLALFQGPFPPIVSTFE